VSQTTPILSLFRFTGKKLVEPYNQSEINDDALQALTVIESRVKEAMQRYAGTKRSDKGLRKCKNILDTCAIQLKALEIFGISNIEQYHKVRNMLIKADVITGSVLARKESKGAHGT